MYQALIDETTLIEQARRGDAEAFAELVRRHADVAQRVAWVITSSAADAADAAQEGFVRAWTALPRFRPGADFRPWLLKIVANAARNRRRSTGRALQLSLRAEAAEPRTPAVDTPETVVLSHERRDTLLAGLNGLSERDRDVLVCRYLLDLSEAETAAALGWPRGTVKSRTSRALRKLRAELEHDAVAVGDMP